MAINDIMKEAEDKVAGVDPMSPIKDPMVGEKKSPVTVNTDLTFEPVDVQGPYAPEGMNVGELATKATAELDKVSESLSSLRSINQARLEGRIPDDVARQIRQQASEKAIAGGLGDSAFAGRAIEARDLGLTSLQLQDAGIATQTNLDKMGAALGELQQKRAEFTSTFFENTRQFNEKLALDQNNQRLSVKELMLKRDSFNASANAQIIQFISTLAGMQAQASTSLAIADIDDSNIVAGFTNLITRLDSMLPQTDA